jgi:Tol biopolymer transport system component/DNA-binding winged helix-turn-helix (wHTH) protein
VNRRPGREVVLNSVDHTASFMAESAAKSNIIQFGLFELDLQARELRKSGIRIKLQEQPFQILSMLLERQGQIVTREELQKRLWPEDTFVDFDLSLNSAVKKLRQALNDDSENPRFIETLYRRGYRFIAPISTASRERPLPVVGKSGFLAVSAPVSNQAPDAGNRAGSLSDSGRSGEAASRSRKGWAFIAVGCLAVLFAGLMFELNPKAAPRITGFTQITSGGKVHQMSALATDGQRLYFQAADRDRIALGEVSVSGGDSALIATPFLNTFIDDIAPDGSSILIGSFEGTNEENPIWLLPLPAGSPRPLGAVAAHWVVWSSDGHRLLYARGADLSEANPDGSDARKLATLGGNIEGVRVSPDGRTIRLTLEDKKTGSSELWELNRDGSQPHSLLPNWNVSPHECCGRWTPDGRYFLFSSLREGRTSLWALPERHSRIRPKAKPVQLTNGPLDFWLPVPSRDGKRIFALGGQPRSEVLRYDGRSFVPYLDGASAADLAFSADGQRVAYVSVPERALWSSKIDGSDRIQLSDPGVMEAALPRWSPDGTQIVFMARTLNTDWRVYLVAAIGQGLRELIPGATAGFDPGWSPDGKSIVLSVGDLGGVSNKISILDRETGKVSPVPGGENLFSPRWSPDGRYIAGITTDSQALMLFDRTNQQWTALVRMSIGYPSWSHDGQYLYFDSTFTEDPAFFRVRISDHRLERLASLKDIHRLWGANAEWSGLGPGDSLLVTRNISSPEIYALDWQP